MKYNFDEIITRRGSNCIKWDEAEDPDIIPLWVADMDFHVYPGIVEALRKRVEHGVFGYSLVPQSYYDAVIRWFRDRHGAKGWKREHFIYTIGVVPAISAIIHALTLPGDKVLVTTPVYNCFFSSIRNQGCIAEEVPLLLNETYQLSPLIAQPSTLNTPPAFTVDWEAFERACAEPKVRIFLLCNPHNPAGRVWTREELQRMGEICFRHNVFVISDEIHCDITEPGCSYVPFASVSEVCKNISVTCIAPTKAFNLAGIKSSAVVVPDKALREKIFAGISRDETDEPNILSCPAAIAAFNEGEAWLDELCEYISKNRAFTAEFIADELPELHLVKGECTYLLWLDVSSLNTGSRELSERLRKEAGVYFSPGADYGETRGRAFLRINIACPLSQLKEALSRLKNDLRLLF